MSGAHQNLDLERLARIIAMGGSGHDGEALAALRLADHSIRAAGMTWHDVLLPGRLIEGLVAQGERLRDELAALRAAKAAETKQLRDALAAVRRRRSPTHQRGPKGIIILCCLSVLVVAMYMIGDGISDCVRWPGSRRKLARRQRWNCTARPDRVVGLHSKAVGRRRIVDEQFLA
jgi:hypothetical protein